MEPKSCMSNAMKMKFINYISKVLVEYMKGKFHFSNEFTIIYFSLAFDTLRDYRVYRICCVVRDLKYQNTSAPLPPCIFGKLGNCRI